MLKIYKNKFEAGYAYLDLEDGNLLVIEDDVSEFGTELFRVIPRGGIELEQYSKEETEVLLGEFLRTIKEDLMERRRRDLLRQNLQALLNCL